MYNKKRTYICIYISRLHRLIVFFLIQRRQHVAKTRIIVNRTAVTSAAGESCASRGRGRHFFFFNKNFFKLFFCYI